MLFHKGKIKLLIALFAIALILSGCSRNVDLGQMEKNYLFNQGVK